MANIENLAEAWDGHSGLEVESFIKSQLTALAASLGGKFGHVAFNAQTMTITFYDQPGGTVLGSVQLGGQVYTIDIQSNLSQVFYVLADETTKMMTITPSTTVSSFGSSTQEPFPEPYTYVVAVNSGSGYVDRVDGSITTGGSATFDLKPFLSTGDNYIRVSVTGTSSGQTRTMVFTGTLTTLTMSCNHTWQNVWHQGDSYNITGIRFAGNLIKELHVSLDGVELTPVTYSANQSYTTTSTFYTIPASAFPSGGSAVHSVKLWMSAQGVSTPQVSFNIMCAATDDTTPLVAINAITDRAYNFTSGTIFSYAVYSANKVAIDLSATLNSVIYVIASNVQEIDLDEGIQYPFAYSLEVDTGANETKIGSLAVSAKAYQDSTEGVTSTASTIFDNTYSYLATPGALFYLNAATRSNSAADRETIINEAGASENFPATYSGVWSGLSWHDDGWGIDNTRAPLGPVRALSIPAGCSLTIPGLNPLSLISSYEGMTIEMMLQCGSPSDYSEPVFSISSGDTTPLGILIYPTKIVVWGSSERDEDYQTVNFSENTMTHICVTILKGYEGRSGKNICSVYINGISNVNFSFDSQTSFGNGGLTIGQAHTDAYLYKMRVYGIALEPSAVLNNFLNCIVDGVEFTRSTVNTKNDILLGSSVDYDLVKRAGLNTMVVITPNNEAIPSVDNKVTIDGCTVRFEYAGQPTKNATVGNVSMDGQGTTSKKYYRWNLRWKTGSNTTWVMGDGTTLPNGKEGRMINDTNYVMVDRITAKKNIASSPQGHKMGMTGLYNDIFHQIGLNSELPDPDYRVAVYQFPFVGFQYNSANQSYDFIGIYTCGPDKGSKVTFGYKKSSYPDCLSIEGPNHAPRGTRFLCPWVDVAYSPDDETLTFGGEEGWDCDYVKYETSTEGTQADWDNILNLYETEWQPAYNCVYDNSPYLASYQEVINGLANPNITTLADLLTTGNAATVKDGRTNNMILKNEFIAFYDSSYDLYFYRRSTGKYEKLPAAYAGKKNALTDLSAYLSAIGASTSSPTTAQIIQARGARFKATMGNYFSVNQTLYHYCFCLLFAVTDNYAKNSYPFKFQKLTTSGAGNRWGWRQDDLDSVLMTDNNGTNTKKYSVEHLDTFDGVQIFQGGDAALWVLIKNNYEEECRSMMGQIASAATALATSLGIAGSGAHQSLFNLTSYHCWDHSSKYFPATAYESDRRWSYIEPWLLAGQTKPNGEIYPDTYNGVYPLTQALGDQLQGEKLWVERRIAYIFSKYHIGAFHGTDTGMNAIVFTLAEAFTFRLIPAIDLYPVVSLVEDDVVGRRTPAGEYDDLTISTSGDSNNSIHGGDWLASLGDLSQMRLTSRGGSSSIPFSISAARLQTLKIGGTGTVLFNATVFGVTSPTLVELDARNTTTITNTVDLLGCPRLRTCLFEGSGAAGLLLPVGAKLEVVSFPDAAATVFMHSLPFLTEENLLLPTLTNVRSLYINNCAHINPMSILERIMGTEGEALEYVTLIWYGTETVTQEQAEALAGLADRNGYVSYEDGSAPTNVSGKPDIEGTITPATSISVQIKDAIDEADFEGLTVAATNAQIHIDFEDDAVETVCLANYDTNGDGKIQLSESYARTGAMPIGVFSQNTEIVKFNELKYFRFTSLENGTDTVGNGVFKGCTNLEEITLPPTLTSIGWSAFAGDTKLRKVVFPERGVVVNRSAFNGCSSLVDIGTPIISSFGGYTAFYNCGFTTLDLSHCTFTNTYNPDSLNNGTFRNCTKLETVILPLTCTLIGSGCFYGCTKLASVMGIDNVITVANSAFRQAGLTGELNLPNVTGIGAYAFNYNEITSVILPKIVSMAGTSGTNYSGSFSACTRLSHVDIGPNCTTIQYRIFQGCTALQTFICRAETPPSLLANVFTATNSTFKIYVPYSADHTILDAYKAATNWSSYAARMYELDEDGNIPS